MLVSVITVCFNSAATIRDTIESVLNQRNINLEYIIVDGGSSDETPDIIRSYGRRISHVVCEPDQGMYDAMNKGVALASGDIIGILNADDIYESDSILQAITGAFTADTMAVYGDLLYVDPLDTRKVRRTWISGKYRAGAFLDGWMPPHPTFFVRRQVYERYGNYSLVLKSAADYEFMLRVIHKHNIPLAYLNQVVIRMRAGGKSNASLKNRLIANREDRLAWSMNKLQPGKLTLIKKPLSKLRQFFDR